MFYNKHIEKFCFCLITAVLSRELYTYYKTFWSSTTIKTVNVDNEKHHPSLPMDVKADVRRFAVFGCSTPHEDTHRGFDYAFYLPLTVLAWQRIGFESIILIIGDKSEWQIHPILSYVIRSIDQLTDATVLFIPAKMENRMMLSQTARIFVANMDAFPGGPSDIIITTDSDLWPLRKEHFHQPEGLNRPLMLVHSQFCGPFSFGGRNYRMLPMSHISASKAIWREIINVNFLFIANDSTTILDYFQETFDELIQYPVVFDSEDWYLDQKLVSILVDEWISRQESKEECVYEVSDANFLRIDRGNWDVKNISSSFSIFFDSHLPLKGFAPSKWNSIQPLLQKMYGNNSMRYEWCNNYAIRFHEVFTLFNGTFLL